MIVDLMGAKPSVNAIAVAETALHIGVRLTGRPSCMLATSRVAP